MGHATTTLTLNSAGAAAALGITRQRLAVLVREGRIPAERREITGRGGRRVEYRFRVADVKAFGKVKRPPGRPGKPEPPDALRYSGLMGHAYTIVEAHAGDWRSAGESDDLARARRIARGTLGGAKGTARLCQIWQQVSARSKSGTRRVWVFVEEIDTRRASR